MIRAMLETSAAHAAAKLFRTAPHMLSVDSLEINRVASFIDHVRDSELTPRLGELAAAQASDQYPKFEWLKHDTERGSRHLSCAMDR